MGGIQVQVLGIGPIALTVQDSAAKSSQISFRGILQQHLYSKSSLKNHPEIMNNLLLWPHIHGQIF